MSFQPVVPLSGIAGWRFLQRTEAAQKAAFAKDPALAREADYFRTRIGEIDSAAELVADRTLLKVALGAFGLEEAIDGRAFLRKVLEEGTEREGALALRLVDRRYRDLARSFGFGNASGARTARPGFAETIIAAYRTRRFEAAIGEADEAMGLALHYRRAIAEVTASSNARAVWYTILGDRPVRAVLEQALGLPAQVSRIDLGKQVELFADRAGRRLGIADPRRLAEPALVEEVIRRHLATAQIAAGPAAAPAALALLQGGSSAGLLNLLLARA